MSHILELQATFEWELGQIKPRTVLDVGAGRGLIGETVRRLIPDAYIVAVEAWPVPLVAANIYNEYLKMDILNYYALPRIFDLTVLGDVIEHFEKTQALYLVRRALATSRWVIISTPKGFMPQAAIHGNPLEIHRSGFTLQDFERFNVLFTAEGMQIINVLLQGNA